MKSVPFVALALSLMATSALAQPRHHWRDEGQSEVQSPRAEQPRQRPERPQPQAQPQAAPPASAEHIQGRGGREGPPVARQVVVPQAQPERVERREFGGRRGDGGQPQVVQPQAPQANPGDRRGFGGRRGEGQVAPAPQAVPQVGQRQWQGDPRQRGDRQQVQPQAPATNGQWDGRRDGRDGARDGRSGGRDGRDWNGDGRPDSRADRNGSDGRDWNRDGRSGSGDRSTWTRDPNGWNRDGGRGGWDRDHRGPTVRPDWARRDGRYDRDRNRPRYDQRRYPHYFSFQQRFRLPYYAAPFGYYDYEWGFGDYLPWGWYGPSYWIENWFDYGLPPPPIGCEWVRVGRDAVLIDTFDGRVLSVARLLFW